MCENRLIFLHKFRNRERRTCILAYYEDEISFKNDIKRMVPSVFILTFFFTPPLCFKNRSFQGFSIQIIFNSVEFTVVTVNVLTVTCCGQNKRENVNGVNWQINKTYGIEWVCVKEN